VVPALEDVTGIRTGYRGPRTFADFLPRGHDKTSGTGRLLNWVLAYGKRHLDIVTAAADEDQAALITEAMQNEARLNPWIARRVKHGRSRAYGQGGVVKVLASNAFTNWGLNADLLIIDEITWWKKKDLWDVLWSGRRKREGSVLFILSNAGIIGSWQYDLVFHQYRDDPDWAVYQAPGPLASWMSPSKVHDLRKGLPKGLSRRVFDNRWIDPAEESDFLTRAEVEACEALGRELGLVYVTKGTYGVQYVAGIDYGPRRDRTVCTVVHQDQQGRLIVDRMDVFQGSPESPVPIALVEKWIEEVSYDYQNPVVVCDEYQLEGTIQKYENRLPVERFKPRGGQENYRMAENLRSYISNRKIAWYPGAGTLVTPSGRETLTDELLGLVLKITPYGYRFDHESDFHDDRACALGMAALKAAQRPASTWTRPEPLRDPKETDPTQRVLRGVRRDDDPAHRRGIFGM
jgi:hypothetical protein